MIGPCAKQVVVALLVTPKGDRFLSTNFCNNAQKTCPRGDMPSGVGYEKCVEICQQPGHAEENVLKLAGEEARGGTIHLYGHTYACDSCRKMASEAGVLIEVRSEPASEALAVSNALIQYKRSFETRTPVALTYTVDRGVVDEEEHEFRLDHAVALQHALARISGVDEEHLLRSVFEKP